MIVLKIRPVFPISFCHQGASSSSVPLQYFQILFYNIPDILRTLEHEIVDNVEKVRRVSMDALIIIHHELVIDEPGTEIAKPVFPHDQIFSMDFTSRLFQFIYRRHTFSLNDLFKIVDPGELETSVAILKSKTFSNISLIVRSNASHSSLINVASPREI